MKKTFERERPFEYLRRSGDGTPFPEETVKNWYAARAYVLDKFKDIAIAPGSGGHLTVVVDGDSPMMLAVVRQVALSAHFFNYEEYDLFDRLACLNRTVIALVSSKAPEVIEEELGREEYLCNLMKYCKHSIYGDVRNADSYIDVELEVVRERPDCEGAILMDEKDVREFVSTQDPEILYSIDTRKAVLSGRVYNLGAVIDNLPAEDIHSPKRYIHALDTFQYKLLQEKLVPLINPKKWSSNQIAVKNGLSSIICADCFESRARGIRRFASERGVSEQEAWATNNEALSVSEHHRWVVEKLILGFSPIGTSERFNYERLFGKKRFAYWKQLKTDPEAPVHIDLCSYRDLRRIDPENMKYDSFLLLAIPLILQKLKK